MRIGFDLDGVLSNFVYSFNCLLIKVSGKRLLDPDTLATSWDWFTKAGYSPEEVALAWKEIDESREFWINLLPLDGMLSLSSLRSVAKLAGEEVYFITNRQKGKFVKSQTEGWLQKNGFYFPTVLVTAKKGVVASALQLDVYIDDYHKNANEVITHSSCTRTYLLNTLYNTNEPIEEGIVRVESVEEMLRKEGLR